MDRYIVLHIKDDWVTEGWFQPIWWDGLRGVNRRVSVPPDNQLSRSLREVIRLAENNLINNFEPGDKYRQARHDDIDVLRKAFDLDAENS